MTRWFGARSGSVIASATSALIAAVAMAETTPFPAADAPQVFEYKVNHAVYGEIGTYKNIVERRGEMVAVRSTLDIAVRFLGIPVYRQAGERLERWHGDRLIEFRSVTRKNGETLEVTGEAREDAFVVKGPDGIVQAPKDVRPSNPWSARMLNAETMMSTTTGKVMPARVKGGGEDIVLFNGSPRKVRRFDVQSDKQEFVLLDERDVPVVIGTEDDGSRVEFVLTRISNGEAGAATVRRDKLPPAITVANEP